MFTNHNCIGILGRNISLSFIKAVILLTIIFSFFSEPAICQLTFTKIYSGDIVYDGGIAAGAAWGDYNSDGFIDMFVANWYGQNNFLYKNNGDGTFTKIISGSLVNDKGFSSGPCWGDYDNDGDLDLFVANQRNEHNFLYRNNGDGSFFKVAEGDIVNDYGSSYTAAWIDYDNDGNLDLFVANSGQFCFLYKNNGDGTFKRIKNTAVVNDKGRLWNASWGDYNNDGCQDLFMANSSGQNNLLYKNNGDGSFKKITEGPVVNDGGYSMSGSWGDYDNDGDLDLFVGNAGTSLGGTNDFLYKNNGDGTFTKVTEGLVVNNPGYTHGGVWADLDNDGDLDLFVGLWGLFDNLFLNNGDGTFEQVLEGNIVKQNGFVSSNIPVADYDNDGDVDVFIPNWENQKNLLFRNNSKGNNWLRIKGKGIKSNSFGIGSKVRIKAVINGKLILQMREISSNTGCRSQSAMEACFGLGDAEIVEGIRFEWPSGVIDEMKNVRVNQILTVTEGKGITKYENPAPPPKLSLTSALFQVFQNEGTEKMMDKYKELRKNDYEKYDFSENALVSLGTYVLSTLGRPADAEKIYRLNIEYYPESVSTVAGLGSYYKDTGEQKKAKEYFERALTMISEDRNMDEGIKENLRNNIGYELKNLKNKH